MNKFVISAASLVLLASVLSGSATAAGPRASGDSDWPAMSQPAGSSAPVASRPDSSTQCGIYDNYCYSHGRLSLDYSSENR
jgi:hypothetical protein